MNAGLALAAQLAHRGVLRSRPGGLYWTRPERAVDRVDLRSAGAPSIDIVEQETGRVLGHVDGSSADLVVHPGAVYLHQGESYLCDTLDRELGEALVRRARPGYVTQPQVETSLSIVAERGSRALGSGRIHLGEVDVASRVTEYLRRDEVTGQVWDATPLELPERVTRTVAVWWTLDAAVVSDELTEARLDAGVHAAEHVCLGLLPAFAPCDRWDIGAVSDIRHPQTEKITVFVHDQQAGGTGFAERAYEVADRVAACGSDPGHRVFVRARLPSLHPVGLRQQPRPGQGHRRRRAGAADRLTSVGFGTRSRQWEHHELPGDVRTGSAAPAGGARTAEAHGGAPQVRRWRPAGHRSGGWHSQNLRPDPTRGSNRQRPAGLIDQPRTPLPTKTRLPSPNPLFPRAFGYRVAAESCSERVSQPHAANR